MTLLGTLTAVALDATAVGLLAWTTWTGLRSRERPSAGPFVALLAILTAWALFALGSELPGVSSGDGWLSAAFVFGQLGCALFLPGAWTVYALSFTGRGTGLTRRRILLLAGIAAPIPLAVAVFAVRPPERVIEQVIASLLGTEILYLTVLFFYATYLLVGLGRRHARVSKLQIAVVTAGASAPYLLGAAGDGAPPADGVTLGLLASGGLFAVAVRRYPVMTGFPKADYVARTRVVEALREAVVVLDWDDHVIDANAATAALFDRSTAELIGEPIRAVADGLGRSDLSTGAAGTVALQTTKGRRQFQFSVSSVDEEGADGESDPVARAVVLRDVTDRETREQRLTVLNRILRHNVRNELDVVLAHAERVEDEELRAGIRDSASDLVAVSDKARAAEEIMTASTEPPEPVDLTDVAATVVEEYRAADRAGSIALDCPDGLTLSTHPTIVREVLSELVDNALAHADGSSPAVEIGVRDRSGPAVELTVADDGPGIPEREQRILADGTETQLAHGRGIGLWFVNWAVTQLGGDLAFGENEPEGSVVTVRLYGAEYAS